MLYLLYKHQYEIPIHFTFAAKGMIYYVTSNGDLFTCEDNVISMCEDIIFSRESSPGILLVPFV